MGTKEDTLQTLSPALPLNGEGEVDTGGGGKSPKSLCLGGLFIVTIVTIETIKGIGILGVLGVVGVLGRGRITCTKFAGEMRRQSHQYKHKY